ncbi:MAG: tetratricopeptide repeat protein [Acidobacteria bacterium]|nr:tetratricopeptide repeat protein [Acidobacteriota bacterium]
MIANRPQLYILPLALAMSLAAQTSLEQRYSKGAELLREGRAQEALALLQPVLAESSGESRIAVLDALGRAEMELGRPQLAKRNLEAALALCEPRTPAWGIVHNNLGRVYLELHELARAEAAFTKAMEFYRAEPRVWQSLGQVQLVRNRVREAEASIRRAISLASAEAEVSIASDLAAVLRAKRQYGEAAAILRDVIARTKPGQARARMRANLGDLYAIGRDHRQAAEQLRLALAEMETAVGLKHPDVAAILELYREQLQRFGRKAEAAEAGRRAAEIRASFAGLVGDRRISVDWRDLISNP